MYSRFIWRIDFSVSNFSCDVQKPLEGGIGLFAYGLIFEPLICETSACADFFYFYFCVSYLSNTSIYVFIVCALWFYLLPCRIFEEIKDT